MLENHGVLTAQVLADHFEVSVRTIYRDLECLSEAGYSIITESGKGGGIQLAQSKRLRVNAMDEAELQRLVEKLCFNNNKDQVDHNLQLKIRGQLSPQSQVAFDKLSGSLLVDPTDWRGATPIDRSLIACVQGALRTNQKLRMHYINQMRQRSERVVWPLGLVKKVERFYLIAFCELRQEVRTFNLSKIVDLNLLEMTFETPGDFDLKTYWDNASMVQWDNQAQSSAVRGLQSETKEEGTFLYPVLLRLNSGYDKEAILASLSGFRCLYTSEGFLSCDLISPNIALSQMWRMGHMVKIIEPQVLRDQLIKQLDAIYTKQTEA